MGNAKDGDYSRKATDAMRAMIHEIYHESGIEGVGAFLSKLIGTATHENECFDMRHILIVTEKIGDDEGMGFPVNILTSTDITPRESALEIINKVVWSMTADRN